jgi:hypothetical protein
MDYSTSFWIKLKNYSNNFCSIILSNRNKSKLSGSMFEIAGSLSTEFQNFIFYKNYTTASDTNSAEYVSSSNALELNQWHHICITYKYNGGYNNLIKIYFDGELVSSKLIGATIDPENEYTFLGCEPEQLPVDYGMNGYLDEVRFYNKELIATEVNSLYKEK